MKLSHRHKQVCRASLAAGLTLSFLLVLNGCGAKKTDAANRALLEQELEQLRATNGQLQQLRAENQDLPRLRKDNEEVQRLREQTKDLARLREENTQLRGELQALKAPKPKP
jgi:hypothetical protein